MTFTKCTRAKDRRGVDLISDALPFGRRRYGEQAQSECNRIRPYRFNPAKK